MKASRLFAPALALAAMPALDGCIPEAEVGKRVATPHPVPVCAGPITAPGVVERGVSTLPVPPRPCNVARPSLAPGAPAVANVKVLPWAGFRSALTATFDDSQPSQIAHYAELQAMGVPLTFYVTTGSSGLAGYDATWTQAVKDGHEIGNHSVHHCHADLGGCTSGAPLQDLGAELDEATRYITQHFGQSDVWTAASPFGDTGYDATAGARFFLNRGVQGGTIAPGADVDPWNLPSLVGQADDTAQRFDGAIDEAHAGGAWLILLFHTIRPTNDNWFAPIHVGAISDSIVHARSLADVWIDTVASVGAYWRGQKVFSAAAPVTSGTTTTWTWALPPHFPPGKYLRVTVDGGTLAQRGAALPWVTRGYYEVSLDAGSLSWSP